MQGSLHDVVVGLKTARQGGNQSVAEETIPYGRPRYSRSVEVIAEQLEALGAGAVRREVLALVRSAVTLAQSSGERRRP